jgi:hypothetical protein
MQKKDLLVFLQHIALLKKSREQLSVPIEYIIYSPYIFNAIEGCKKEKTVMKKLVLKELDITSEGYNNIMSDEQN